MTNQTNPQKPLLPAPQSRIPAAPIHPLAALTTLVLDNIFGIPELFETLAPPALILTSVSIGVVGAVTTMFVQRFLAKDSWGASIAKGLVMGVIAGVPYSVAGTAVGIPLLGWAGLHEWLKLKPPKNPPAKLPKEEEEIIEADVTEVDKKD